MVEPVALPLGRHAVVIGPATAWSLSAEFAEEQLSQPTPTRLLPRTSSSCAARFTPAGALHRHSVRARTTRAAIPVTASAFAIA
jgi:hypothetical protein